MSDTDRVQASSDAALLLHGMMCVAGVDGTFADAEVRMVEATSPSCPSFAAKTSIF